jgi:chemotaxis signal transduction protein
MTRAEEMRAAFDRSFAEAPTERGRGIELLRIELAGEPYVIPLGDVASIHVDLKIVPMPATVPTLIGVIAVRGVLIAVYDLRALRGLSTESRPRWIVVADGVGFAFDGFLGHLSVLGSLSRGVVEHDGRLHPVVELKGALHG